MDRCPTFSAFASPASFTNEQRSGCGHRAQRRQQRVDLRLRPHRDAEGVLEPRHGEVAHQDVARRERARDRAQIDPRSPRQHEVRLRRRYAEAEALELRGEPRPRRLDAGEVFLHGREVAERSLASRSGCPKASPTRSPASENDLESVRSTSTFASRPTNPSACSRAKSTYASSTTRRPGSARASVSTSASGTSVPEGEFGLQRKVTRARAAASAGGSEKSSGKGTRTASPPCTATSVS